MSRPTVAIVTDDPGWHGRRLRTALSLCGYDSSYVSLTECRLDIASGGDNPVTLPGFAGRLPDGIFVRGVPGGSLEQVILRLDMLHALTLMGVVVYNNPGAIERTVDKAMTSLRLQLAGVPTPATWVCESESDARAVCQRELAAGRPVVMKPLFGSQGTGVTLIERIDGLPDIDGYNGVWYLQRFVSRADRDWRDIRVLVVGGIARAAMLRRNDTWITNRAQGGRCESLALDAQLAAHAEDAARAVDIDYAGVDLLVTDTGELLVTEVNSIPAWQGLQSVCGLDVAQMIVDHFVARMAATGRLEALP